MIMLFSDDHVIQWWSYYSVLAQISRTTTTEEDENRKDARLLSNSKEILKKKCENLTMNMILSYGEEFLQGRASGIVPTFLIYAATRKSELKCFAENYLHAGVGEGVRTDIACLPPPILQ